MQIYWIHTQDNVTRLELREAPLPHPGPNQISIRVRAASLNRGDIMARIKRHRADIPRPLGVDAAGEIAALGTGVTGWQVGEKVIARVKACFAEYAVADIAQIAHMPARLSWEHAAAVPAAYVTAYEALIQLGGLKAGETVLVTGASSGVGVAAVQLAKLWRARLVLGTSGSDAKLERLRALGLDVGIRARAEDFSAQALGATAGRGVDLCALISGGTAFSASLRSLADFGRMAIVGYVDNSMRVELDMEAVHGKRLKIFGISNSPLKPEHRAEAMRGFVHDVLPAIADGRIEPQVDRVFAFHELEAARKYMESDAVLGKIVVTIG
jgi:NADPH2:quinone reductase